jgi:hypothetical protein
MSSVTGTSLIIIGRRKQEHRSRDLCGAQAFKPVFRARLPPPPKTVPHTHSRVPRKPSGFRRGYPAWIRTKNNASKGRCVTVTPRGNRLADLRFSTAQRKLQLGGTNNSRFCRQKSPLGDVRQPGAVALQSKSGTRCYSRGLGRRMSIVVPLP